MEAHHGPRLAAGRGFMKPRIKVIIQKNEDGTPSHKTCTKCLKMTPLDGFNVSVKGLFGKASACGECARNHANSMNRLNPEKKKQSALRFIRSEGGKSYRQSYNEANKERFQQYFKEYKQSNKLKVRQSVKAYERRWPEKAQARGALQNAVKRGVVERQPCTVCGCEKSEGHHEDYSKPLEVVWLCRVHHVRLHVEKAKAEKMGKAMAS